MTYNPRTGPWMQKIGNVDNESELATNHPASNYDPGTMAYAADRGWMYSDGNTWISRREQLLFKLTGADMHITTDQIFTKIFPGTNYVTQYIIARQRTGGGSVTCAGGIYDVASKGGNALVAATQSWVTLAAAVIVVPTLAAVALTALGVNTPYLSLTTGSTAACTADIWIFGMDIS